MGNKPAPDTSPVTTLNPLYDTNATLAARNCSRWKLWDLCRNDPEFPKPPEHRWPREAAVPLSDFLET